MIFILKKRLFCVIACLCLLFVLSSCGFEQLTNDDTLPFDNGIIRKNDYQLDNRALRADTDFEIRGAWLTYLELQKSPKKSEREFRAYISKTMSELSSLSINTLFVHVRPFADAIYESKIFPSSACVVKNQGDKLPFDFLGVIIDEAERYGIRVHGWINPYRIMQRGGDKTKLFRKSLYYTLPKKDIIECESGIYLSPASQNAQRIIVEGVRELLLNYKLCGIHIDDYFYPSTSSEIDSELYLKYTEGSGKLSLDAWRRENVNSLILGLYSCIKSINKNLIFSISPSGDIEKNKNKYYADVTRWGSEEGFCDVLIPQIYFGFKNESLPFKRCVKSWRALLKNENIKLCAGLAVYKLNTEDAFAGASGADEWIQDDEILEKQIKTLFESGYNGYCLYSADYIKIHKKNIKKGLKKFG